MKLTAVIFALLATAFALPQRHNGGPGNNRPGNNGPPATIPPANAPPTSTPPANNQPSTSTPSTNNGGTIDPSLVPDFGITAGIPSTNQKGSCQGNNNVNIPCQCPPSKAAFISVLEKFNAQGNIFGDAFSFNTNTADQSPATQLARVNAAIVALQNFDQTSKGEGCPAGGSAPGFISLRTKLQAEV